MCIGVTGEVFYTGVKSFIYKRDKRLQGYSQIWVMPMYAFLALYTFEPIHLAIRHWNIALRFCIYALLIFTVEYIFGYLYKRITGACPWEYKGRWNIHGYIDIAHFPFWGALGLLGEIVHNYLVSI